MFDDNKEFGSPPPITFFRSTSVGLAPMHGKDLEEAVPVEWPGFSVEARGPITYRDYFQAIERVIRSHWSEIAAAAAISDKHLAREVSIIGEKHGSEYHPARIVVDCADHSPSFVMNVALSSRGLSRIEQEYEVLRSMGERSGPRFVPKVYFLSEHDRHFPARMFLGEWLNEHYEFHLTTGLQGRLYDVALWDQRHATEALSREIAREVFRQAAFILTSYYNTMTYSEIYPWHHAAGDFVVRIEGETVSVKLIAARQYAPRIVFPPGVVAGPADAALVFFANLSLRNRLDRLDGVGEVVFADRDLVGATLDGFLGALRTQAENGPCTADFASQCTRLAKGFSPADWVDLFRAVVDSYDAEAPDVPVIMEHLADHIFEVYRLTQALP